MFYCEGGTMKIYKAKVILDVVIEAKDADDAILLLEQSNDGTLFRNQMSIERLTQVHAVNELPRGWDGSDVALHGSNRPACQEHSIRYWLEDAKV
jgi:hypothetical protein